MTKYNSALEIAQAFKSYLDSQEGILAHGLLHVADIFAVTRSRILVKVGSAVMTSFDETVSVEMLGTDSWIIRPHHQEQSHHDSLYFDALYMGHGEVPSNWGALAAGKITRSSRVLTQPSTQEKMHAVARILHSALSLDFAVQSTVIESKYSGTGVLLEKKWDLTRPWAVPGVMIRPEGADLIISKQIDTITRCDHLEVIGRNEDGQAYNYWTNNHYAVPLGVFESIKDFLGKDIAKKKRSI